MRIAVTKEVDKKKVEKKVYPIDLESALKDGFEVVDKKLDSKKLIAEIKENTKRYQSKK